MTVQNKFVVKPLNGIKNNGTPIGATRAGTTNPIRVYEWDRSNKILKASGTEVPTDTTSGYAKGCIYIDENVTAGSTGFYENVGTSTSCNFDQIGSQTTLANGAVDTDQLAADAVTGAKIEDDAVSLEHLDSGVTPSHVVKYAGEVTWTGSGATLASTVTGVLVTDLVVASFHTLGTEGTILQGAYASAADTITFTLDAANTSNDAVITYVVYRAAA